MASNISMDSVDSDVIFVEQISNEPSPQRNNSPKILNSTQLWGRHARETSSVSSVAPPEPYIVTLDNDSNGPTFPYGFGTQQLIVPPSLRDLNLLPNPLNILATMAVINHEHDNNYSPQSPELSEPSPISALPMNVSTFDSWEMPHTTTDDNTFYFDDELRRIYFVASTPSPPQPPRKLKRKLELRLSFPKRGGVSQHICEACGQMIPSTKDIPGPSTKK